MTIKISPILLAVFKWDNDKMRTIFLPPRIWSEPVTAQTQGRSEAVWLLNLALQGNMVFSWLFFCYIHIWIPGLQRNLAILKLPCQRDHLERLQTEILNHYPHFWVFSAQSSGMRGVMLQMTMASTTICRN